MVLVPVDEFNDDEFWLNDVCAGLSSQMMIFQLNEGLMVKLLIWNVVDSFTALMNFGVDGVWWD